MKSPYAIDPSLNIFLPDILPFNRFAFLFPFLNAGIRCHNRWLRRKRSNGLVITDIAIPAAGGKSIPAVLFKPDNTDARAPLLIYYHGGGFAITYASLHIELCEHYARAAQCVVLLVDYRLMPAYRWPQGFDDCFHALEWALMRPAELGIDSDNIVVGGDSAGGALAAGVAQKARDRHIALTGQLLIYPVLDSRCITTSAIEYTDTLAWNAGYNRSMWSMYLSGHNPHLPPAYAAPGLCESLEGLASTYLETAEFDPLHDEGVNYANALLQAGVTVQLNETKGTFHGFELVRHSHLVAQSLEWRVTFLKKCFAA